eukprot:maker-scaffold1151_size58901-snap-gene-0.10 protein:Tk02419 transcript:maker-scaffold1151_size58901-snap-gene-0.10-mRNA-1 annotation:"hypothetical protein X777_11146"
MPLPDAKIEELLASVVSLIQGQAAAVKSEQDSRAAHTALIERQFQLAEETQRATQESFSSILSQAQLALDAKEAMIVEHKLLRQNESEAIAAAASNAASAGTATKGKAGSGPTFVVAGTPAGEKFSMPPVWEGKEKQWFFKFNNECAICRVSSLALPFMRSLWSLRRRFRPLSRPLRPARPRRRPLHLRALGLAASCGSSAVVQGRRRSKVSHDFGMNLNKTDLTREGKVFSLFNIVKFNNGGCRSTSTISSGGTGSTNRNGTCFTATECANKGGTVAGACAAGFGVCCVFLVSTSGANINQNCTYIRNPNFPNAYDSASQVGYTIQKCDPRVCQVRLDFESFTIQGTGNTDETDTMLEVAGGVCLDMFTVGTNTGSTIPTICGQNTGQHMYIDMGCLSSDTASLNFNFGGTDINRLWEIKVTQLKCNTQGHPTGSGCLQYHTGHTGRFTSFNFLPTLDNHLANQEYGICIRQEEGMCCIEYTPCADTNSYSFDAIKMDPADKIAIQDTDCATLDYIGIEGKATGISMPHDLALVTLSLDIIINHFKLSVGL